MKRLNKKPGRLTLIIIVAAIAGAIGFAVAFALSSSQKATAPTARCGGYCVNLYSHKAEPESLAVKVGDFVQFNSADGKPHSLSLGEGGQAHQHETNFSSGVFKGDEAWRVQFKNEGSFVFHDHLNPKISTVVVVYTPGKDYKIR